MIRVKHDSILVSARFEPRVRVTEGSQEYLRVTFFAPHHQYCYHPHHDDLRVCCDVSWLLVVDVVDFEVEYLGFVFICFEDERERDCVFAALKHQTQIYVGKRTAR